MQGVPAASRARTSACPRRRRKSLAPLVRLRRRNREVTKAAPARGDVYARAQEQHRRAFAELQQSGVGAMRATEGHRGSLARCERDLHVRLTQGEIDAPADLAGRPNRRRHLVRISQLDRMRPTR